MSQLRKMITDIVESRNGLKVIELVVETVKYMSDIEPKIDTEDILIEIDKMIEEKELISVQYILPIMEYRVKMFVLPKGTVIVEE